MKVKQYLKKHGTKVKVNGKICVIVYDGYTDYLIFCGTKCVAKLNGGDRLPGKGRYE